MTVENKMIKRKHMKETKQKNKTQKKFPVTVILGDSLVKDTKGWTLCDESNKVATKHFSGATTTDNYFQPNHAIQKISLFITAQTVLTKSVMALLKLPCCVNLIPTTYQFLVYQLALTITSCESD